jgi:hypothetical protein
MGSAWMDAPATDVNDDTREIRVEYSVVTRGVRRFILDASQYRPSNGLFQREEVVAGSVSTGRATVIATSAAM